MNKSLIRQSKAEVSWVFPSQIICATCDDHLEFSRRRLAGRWDWALHPPES